MTLAIILLGAAVAVSAGLMLLMVYHALCFDDLRVDHRNPVDVCRRLNPVVLVVEDFHTSLFSVCFLTKTMIIPEYASHLLVCLLLIATGCYGSAAISSCLVVYHAWRYLSRPANIRAGLFDPTTILNKSMLKHAQKETVAKLAFYFVLFMICLYNLLLEALRDSPKSYPSPAPGQIPIEPS